MGVEPGVRVEIGHVDDQRIASQRPARVPHPQLDAFADVRTPVRGDET